MGVIFSYGSDCSLRLLTLYVWCDKFFNVFKGAYLQDIADIGIDLF